VQSAGFPTIGVLIELKSANDLALLERQCGLVPSGAEPVGKPSRFVCGLVDRPGLLKLIGAVGGIVRRFTLQAARPDISKSQWSNYRRIRSLVGSSSAAGAGTASAAGGAPPLAVPLDRKPYVGIIDDGFPFAQLGASARARVRMWDQGWLPGYLRCAPDGLPAASGSAALPGLGSEWLLPWDSVPVLRGFFYGRRLDPTRPLLADRNTYAAAEYFDPPPLRTHGAGVLGRMAPWLIGRKAAADAWPAYVSGVAMVQLPSLTVEDTSGGSLDMRVLDGLRFALWQEEATRPTGTKPRRTFVNVSYGTNAGPHDGTSLFEAAVKELLDQHRHVRLALPAGNSHLDRCHCARLLAPSRGYEMPWRILPDGGRDTFMEIWVDAPANMEVEVKPPGHLQPLVVGKGEAKVYAVPDAAGGTRIEFAVIYPPTVAQGQKGTMILVAVSPTRRLGATTGTGMNQLPRTRIGAPHGVWKVKVVNRGGVPRRFDAWVQRGDAAPGSVMGNRQAFFPDSETGPAATHPSTPTGTLNGIATFVHPRLTVVGALTELDGRLSDYSAAGPRRGDAARDHGPDIVIKADRSRALPGLQTTGFSAGARTYMNGTSVACAVYTNVLIDKTKPQPPPLPVAVQQARPTATHAPAAPDSRRGLSVRRTTTPETKPPQD